MEKYVAAVKIMTVFFNCLDTIQSVVKEKSGPWSAYFSIYVEKHTPMRIFCAQYTDKRSI